ncbi:MAG: hypothetical protein KIT84_02275 [Labilithrix sp.]|nr:hypothetical protein [Labilithrix sp.]MCW5809811.1 hypothetical protein [Labilithrix sp.]
MDTTTTSQKNGTTKTKGGMEAIEEEVQHVGTALSERVAEARDLVEDLRDRAEMAIHERPYIVPVAAGAVGLGVGILIGSKLTRMIALGVAGALLSETVRTQLVTIGQELIKNVGDKLDAEDVEEPATSSV